LRLPDLPYKWVVATIFVIGLFMDIMDTTIINVALPTLARDFHATAASTEWVVLGYLLSLAVWIPASGWIGDRFGTKRTFLFALFAFTAASAMCGQAQTLAQLNVFRVLQGVGGGMLAPVGTTMLFRAFPPLERAKASTVLVIPTVLAPALGPILGGWLVTDHSWRWIFYVNLPLGLFGFAFGWLYLKEHREPSAASFDLPGFLLSGGGLALVVYALSQGPEIGWLAGRVVVTGVVGVACFTVLVLVETRVAHPMLQLRLLSERMFRNANIVTALSYGGFLGVLFLLPQFLQGLRGISALQSGLTTFPQAIGVILSSQIAGRLYHRVGPRRLVVSGLILVTSISVVFMFLTLTTSLWWIRLIMFVRGFGMAFTFVPLQAATYANVSRADTGRATAIFSATRQVSASLGVATLATVWIGRTKAMVGSAGGVPAAVQHAQLRGFQQAFFAAAVIAGLAVLSALLVRDADAASTIRRPGQAAPAPVPAGH